MPANVTAIRAITTIHIVVPDRSGASGSTAAGGGAGSFALAMGLSTELGGGAYEGSTFAGGGDVFIAGA
jgi:hypothetical protein